MSNKKEWIKERLDRLVKLTRATEPDNPDDTNLFTPQNIEAYRLYTLVDESYDNLSRGEIQDIMIKANHIWKIRKKIWNGEWDSLPESTLMYEIEEFILQGQKINAIKHYRQQSEAVYGKEASLKDSKDFVDDVQGKMRVEGKIK